MRIETPAVGDILTTRTAGEIKALVCETKGAVACLSTGDRIRVVSPQPGFRKRYRLPISSIMTFGVGEGEREYFFADNGSAVPLSDLNRRLQMTVLSLVPRDHEHMEQSSCPTTAGVAAELAHA